MRRPAPLFALAMVVLACGTPTGTLEPIQLGEPFWLQVGETAVDADSSTAVRFVRVVGDSRCPGGDIQCVWEGEATIEVAIRVGDGAEVLGQINLLHEPRIVVFEQLDRSIEFRDLEGGQPPRADPGTPYRARLVVAAVP